jgi:hypothetical protein
MSKTKPSDNEIAEAKAAKAAKRRPATSTSRKPSRPSSACAIATATK